MRKNANRKKVISIMMGLVLLVSTMAVPSIGSLAETYASYNSREQYVTVTQSGAWSYQELSGGVYTDLAWNPGNSSWNTNAYLATNTDIYMTGQNTVWFHPGAGVDSVLTFTAPVSGVITTKSASGYGVAVGDDSSDGIVFTIKNGDTNIFAPTVITKSNRVGNGTNIDFDITTKVAAGDKIRYIVGMNGTNSGDQTFVTPKIQYREVYPVNNAFSEYSTATQSGLWNYQELANGTYSDMAWDGANSYWHTNAYLQTNTDIYMTGQNTIWFHPGGTEDSVLTYTAPYSGTIKINSASGYGVAVSDDSADGILFTIKKADINLFTPTIITKNNRIGNGNNIDFNITTSVIKGDKIYFIVGKNGNNAGDATFVTPKIAYTDITSYNAYDRYATVTQDGLWNYQELSGTTYSNMAWDAGNTYWHTNAYVMTKQDIYMTGQNMTWFHPGAGIDSVITFTAPKSGSINIRSASGYGVAVGDDSADGIVFTIKNGNTNLFAPTVITKLNRVGSGTNIDFNVNTTVNAGDKIHFIVGMNGNNQGDATYVSPLIEYQDATLVVTGVENNASYDLNNGAVTIGFNTGIANLNGYVIGSGHNVTRSGSYVLKVNSGSNTITDNFTVTYMGDANNDGAINISDLAAIKNHILQSVFLEGFSLTNAKLNGRATVGISDLLSLKKILITL